ncbi:hypothetical protein BC940DRAFT_334666 [Gongronella butleri]|nr:hypothetical protein BC940DRAFT_334666 [Gongronella butleri]
MAQLQSVTLQDETQHFYDFVRLQMKMALETYRDAYIEAGGAEDGAHFLVAELEDSFALTKSVWDEEDNDSFIPVDPQNTTIMLDVQAGQIAADAFDKIVVIIHQNISEDGDMDEQWLLYVPQAYPDVDGPPLIILMRSYEDDAARNHYYGVTGDVDLSAKCELGMFTDYFVAQLPLDARRQIDKYLLVPRNQ